MLNQVLCLGVVLWCWRCVENALIWQMDIYRFLVRSLVDNESNLTRGFHTGLWRFRCGTFEWTVFEF